MSHFRSAFVAFCIVGVFLSPGARADEYAQSISTRLNTTGRTITMSVPLNDDGRTLGEIMVRVDANDAVAVNRDALLRAAGAGFSAETRSRLEGLQQADGYIPVAALAGAGIEANFDTALQELTIRVAPDDRAVGDIDLGQRAQTGASALTQTPAAVSGYLNIVAGVDFAWDGLGSQTDVNASRADGHLELDFAVRAWNTVLENRAIYDGDVDTALCPAGAICAYDHAAGVKRQMTRLMHDLPAENIRVSAGDVDALGAGLQRRADISGVSIEKAPRKLNPLSSSAPMGSGSLRLERPSDVEIRVNGAVLQTLHLLPGVYNWRDLPLTTGANDVEIAIVDDLGVRTTQSARTFSDDRLLALGSNEWGVAGGVPSYFVDEERHYDTGGYTATGFVRYGLSDDVTGLAHLQADENVAMAGVGLSTRTPWGILSVETAGSSGELGSGVAADINWDLVNVGGWLAPSGESLRIHSEYRSAGFHTPGEHLVDLNGIIFPEYNYWLRLDGAYSVPLQDGLTASLSARYQFADPERISYSSYAVDEDRYGADITLSRSLSASSSGSVTLGYSNETYIRSRDFNTQSDGDFRFALHYYWRPDEQTSVAAGYDTLNRQSDLSANRQGGEPNGTWQATVNVQQDTFNERTTANGSIGYQGNRGEIAVTQLSGASSGGRRGFDTDLADQRTLVRAGTSIAFADGHVAIGRPIRSGAFAIVYPHDTLTGNEITVGADDNVVGRSDALGPALITGIPAHTPNSIPVSAADLPIGYSLGSSTLDTFAPYKAGYAFQVGSGNSVSAFGMLTRASGDPISLQAGVAHPEGKATPSVPVFTNAAGRFGAEGLAPGRWIIDLDDADATARYAFVVPDKTLGLFKAGTLVPVQAQ